MEVKTLQANKKKKFTDEPSREKNAKASQNKMASPVMKLHGSFPSSRSTAAASASVRATTNKQFAALASSKAGHVAPFSSSITTTTVATRPSNLAVNLPARASIFPVAKNDRKALKEELLLAIAPLDRGADASPADQSRIDQIAQSLESANPTKDTLKSPLLNGKWELLYTTSATILKTERPIFLRPRGPIFQAINMDTLRSQNIETWPFFNQVTANLTPLSGKKFVVKFDFFKIGGLISRKAPDRFRGEVEIIFVDEELRISRGDKGDLFVFKMVDPSYRVPT